VTRDSTLHTAGVAHARGLVITLSGDVDNALVVISMKGLMQIEVCEQRLSYIVAVC
jgi:voltage-gated potassium channel Kch